MTTENNTEPDEQRDALAAWFCDRYHDCLEPYCDNITCDHAHGYRDADALLAELHERDRSASSAHTQGAGRG